MRVLHVTDCYLPRLGGIELQVHDLACRQARAGHDVAILTTTAGAIDLSEAPVEIIRGASDRHPTERIMYRSTRRGTAALLRTLDRFDAVHVHASSFSPLAFLAAHHASVRGVPTVATVHSLWAKATPLFRAADGLTGWGSWEVVWSAVSNAAAASIRRVVGDRAPVTILPNGVDPDEWPMLRPVADPARLRIAAVSRLARRKRVFELVEMVRAAGDRLPDGPQLEMSIYGEGPKRREIERYLRRHGMEDRVHLMGRRSRAEIRTALSRADLFVAPARLESFGIAALEARCAGLPVVALAGTGAQDFVEHGREGWLVRSDAALVETIVSLARSPEMLGRVAAHNRAVPASISWTGVLRECEVLYGRAAELHGRTWQPVAALAARSAVESRSATESRSAAAGGGGVVDSEGRMGDEARVGAEVVTAGRAGRGGSGVRRLVRGGAGKRSEGQDRVVSDR